MKRTLAIILALFLCLGLFCGCGAEKAATADSADRVMNSTTAVAPEEPKAEMDYGYSYDMPAEEIAEDEVDYETGSTAENALPANTKLIYTAWLELETTAFDAAIDGLNALVSDMGGYFESSRVNNYGSYRSGYYTVRVPAENFDGFCSAVGELCQLNSVERNAQDISEAYYDTESRLVTQQTKLERLQTLLAQAESMEDIISLESAISDTELKIEQLTGTLRKYDSLVGYSTVDISINEVYELTEIEEPVIGFGAKLVEAFKRGSSNFVDSIQRTLLRFARNWVGWIIWIVIIAVVVYFIVRRARKRRANKTGSSLLHRNGKNVPPAEKESDGE